MSVAAVSMTDTGLPGIYLHLLADVLRERGADEKALLTDAAWTARPAVGS